MRRHCFLLLCLYVTIFGSYADSPNSALGISGMTLTRLNGADDFTVEYVAAHSPSDLAGIKWGDSVTAIDDTPAKQLTLEEAHQILMGTIGGTVNMTLRNGTVGRRIAFVRRSIPDVYSQAAAEGDPKAQEILGYYYDEQPRTPDNQVKAASWYLKAADQNNAKAEANLARLYQHGWGVAKDLRTAFALYLRAAKQGDAFAERELGKCFLRGEGVGVSRQDAFAWFYAASQQHDAYGQWNLAYCYQEGLGVRPDQSEALKWYRKALLGLPQNKSLQKAVVLSELKAFLETRDSRSLDLTTLLSVFHREIVSMLSLAIVIYLLGGVLLLFFTFNVPDGAFRLPVAIGWLSFYIESQAAALISVFMFGSILTAGSLILGITVFGALPVIASSLGSARKQVWKSSSASWQTLMLYGSGCGAAFVAIGMGYEQLYRLIMHAPLPLQPTMALFGKARHDSAWLAFGCIAVALPVAEEILFRSYVFEALRKRCSALLTVVITATAFSLIHFQGTYLVPLLAFGLALGWVRIKTNSLRLPVLLHILNNGLSLLFVP
jgi:membrane protease YdiL (CAAX protease family)